MLRLLAMVGTLQNGIGCLMSMRYVPGQVLDTMVIVRVALWASNYKHTVYLVRLRCACGSEVRLSGHEIHGREKCAPGGKRVRAYRCAECSGRKYKKGSSQYKRDAENRISECHAIQSLGLSIMPVSTRNRAAKRTAL